PSTPRLRRRRRDRRRHRRLASRRSADRSARPRTERTLMTRFSISALLAIASTAACTQAPAPPAAADKASSGVYRIEEGFVDVGSVRIDCEALGTGEPLVILPGGPGASHEYLLPYLIPLAKTNRLVFIDERGSGRSTKLEDPSGYTVENMADDVEAVRRA